MNDPTVVSNEAEFERWLIAALQHERQQLFQLVQHDTNHHSPAVEAGRNSEPRPDVSWIIHFSS